MTPKSKLLTVGSVAVAFVVLTGFTTASRGWGPRESDRARQVFSWHVDDRLEALKASPAQKQATRALQEVLFEDGEVLYVGQRTANERMLEFWGSHSPDPLAVHQLVEERMAAFRVYAHKVADSALELHRILTPEQRQLVANEVRSTLDSQ